MKRTNMMKAAVAAVCAGALSLAASAASVTTTLTNTRTAKSGAVVLGKWHAGFSKCLAYAKANNVPLIAVWSNGDNCGHCITYEDAHNSTVFRNWMKASGCVWFFVTPKDADGAQGGTAFNFCKGVSHGGKKNPYGIFPYVRVYWYVDGKKKVDITTSGDYIDGQQRGATGGKTSIAWYKSKLKGYTPTPIVKYTGGAFETPDAEQARLEAEVGLTTNVTVNIARTNATVLAQVSTNTVLAAYPDGTVQTNRLDWASGDTLKSLTLDTTSLTNAGAQIELILLDAAGAGVATSHVTAVETENSPKNPLWIGEKDEGTLDWGEWTMDLDVATNKVRNANAGGAQPAAARAKAGALKTAASGKAHTLVLIGGSMWCPDCAAADLNFFDREEFKTWAKEQKVALVAIDIPNPGKNTASLLSRDVYTTSDRYVTANYTPGYTNEALRVQSGAGYLARHMISDEAAADIAARNLALVGSSTLEGGWNRPEATNKARTGVPHLIVLRDDGTVAGRFNRYSDVGPTAYEPGMLKRLEELFAQIDEDAEEANDSYTTTDETIGHRETVEAKTISFADAQDVYRLDPATTAGQRLKFDVTGETDAQVEVAVLSGDGTVRASATGSLKDGVALDYTVPSTNYYVSVGVAKADGYPVDPFFAHTSEASTLATYTLATDFIALPAETKQTLTVPNHENGMTMELVSNEVYRITGIDAAANAAVLEPLTLEDASRDPGNLYTARVTDTAKLALASATVEFQLWHPGVVGFAAASAFTAESAGTYLIRLTRTGGVSGTATVKAAYDEGRSSKLDNLFNLPAGFENLLEWAEGENDVKTLALTITDNEFADGDQTLYFTSAAGGFATDGIAQMTLTIRDNDKKVPGRLAITATDPAVAKNRDVYVRAGDPLTITVGRENGADGALAATLSASAGDLSQAAFAWAGRDTTPQESTLALDAALAGKTVKVALAPAKGTAVDSSRRTLNVHVVASDVPGFQDGAVTIPATRYVPIAETVIDLDDQATDKTTVKKFSGTLATGLTWKLVDRQLVIAGVPTKAGRTTAVFRAYNGKTAGLVTAVTVEVTDPVVSGGANAATGAAAPLNAAVAATRTFADLPAFDEETKRLAGVLTLTLPRTGRASAKYRTVDGTVSLAAKNWDAIAADGALSVTLTGKAKTQVYTLAVTAAANGEVAATLDDPAYPGGLTCVASGEVWSKKNPAIDFKGYYTVSMPVETVAEGSGTALATGAGFVTLKMNTAAALNAGTFAYAGRYPNGKPFSGSAAVAADGWSDDLGCWTRGVVPLLTAGADALAGAVRVTPGAADPDADDMDAAREYCNGRCSYTSCRRAVHPAEENDIVWRHVEKAAAATYSAVLGAYGTYYVSTESFVDCCKNALGTDKLTFFSLAGLADLPEEAGALAKGAFKAGGAATVAGVNVKYAKATKTAKTATNSIVTADAKNLALTFTLSTGLVTGTYKATLDDGKTTVTLTYAGVVMPGWGTQECLTCGEGGVEAAQRPFISGTAWFDDTLTYADEKGKTRTLKNVRRACPFSVGVEAGQ